MSEHSKTATQTQTDKIGNLNLPHGYVLAHGGIATEQKIGPAVFYPAHLTVRSLGTEANTQVEVVEVEFKLGDDTRYAVLERSALATVRGIVAGLAPRGAYVHDENARKIMAYLNALIAENYDLLPRYTFTESLGTQSDGSIVLPHLTVGGGARYTGTATCHLGSDNRAYEEALRQIAEWGDAWVLWMLLGWSLISPLLNRLEIGRNPVVLVQGSSNIGKTTVARFAQGTWLGSHKTPFLTQGTASTAKGLLQALEALRGLPGSIDEVHTVPLEERLEGVIYGYANRQSYSRGAVNGRVWGGEQLHGFLIMSGEASLETRFSGAANRILQIDADIHLPLGIAGTRGSETGRSRADYLDTVWQRGAGHLAPKVVNDILKNWPTFIEKLTYWQTDSVVQQCGDWAHRVAILMATLEMLFNALDMKIPQGAIELPTHLLAVLQSNRSQLSPHIVIWDRICAFLMQCSEANLFTECRVLQYRGEMVGWTDGENINLLSGTPELLNRIGNSAVQQHSKRWIQEGWLLPSSHGQSTWSKHCPGKGKTARVLVIPRAILENPDDS